MPKKTAKLSFFLICVLWLAAPLAATAQDDAGPLEEMWLLTPKSGQASEFYQALKDHMAYRSEHGDPRVWLAYTPMLGNGLSRVQVRYCCVTWADVEAYREWGAKNPDIDTHFNEHVAPYLDKAAHYFEAVDKTNSHWVDNDDYRYFAVTEFHSKPGKRGDFAAAAEEMSQIALNQGWATKDRSWEWFKRIGGTPVDSLVVPHVNLAELDGGDRGFFDFLVKQMGSVEAATALTQRFDASTRKRSFQIWEYQENLSMKPRE